MIWGTKLNYPCSYGFCPSEAAWKRVLRRHDLCPIQHAYDKESGATWRFGTGHGTLLIVTMAPKYDKPRNYASYVVATILVHEAVHVWQWICKGIGEKEPGMECEAYAIQSISMELIEAYSKTRRKLL